MSKRCETNFESARGSTLYESHGHTCTRSGGHKDSRHICKCGASSINAAHANRKAIAEQENAFGDALPDGVIVTPSGKLVVEW